MGCPHGKDHRKPRKETPRLAEVVGIFVTVTIGKDLIADEEKGLVLRIALF